MENISTSIETENQTYDLTQPEQAIDFLIFALDGQYSSLFAEFLLSHIGIKLYDYQKSFDSESKSIYEVLNDIQPFFELFLQDYAKDNVFYKYIYDSPKTDLIKKQKISKIIDGLKKVLGYLFDFHNAIIFRNMHIENNNELYKLAKDPSFRISYIFYCIAYKLMTIYDYLYSEFYTFIDDRNQFNYYYSNRYNEYLKELKKEVSQNVIENKKPKSKWFFVAELIFNGDIIVSKGGIGIGLKYFYRGLEYKSPTLMGNKIADDLKLKQDTIRPIVTQSISNEGDRNIFQNRNKKTLESFYLNNEEKICGFFKDHFLKLS